MNDKPIIGHYGVRAEGSGDMYSKGANMLHTLRQIVNDDDKWRTVLRKINSVFYHQTVDTEQIENFLIDELNIDLAGFFDQYLRDIRIPKLDYKFNKGNVEYRWNDIGDNFHIPVKVEIDNEQKWIEPTTEWQNLKCSEQKFSVDSNFYIFVNKIN